MFNNKVENKSLEMDFINFNLQIFLSKKIARQTPRYTPLLGEERLLPQSNHHSRRLFQQSRLFSGHVHNDFSF